MQTEQIVAMLIAERDRLSRAIEALQSGEKRRGRPRGSAAVKPAASHAPREKRTLSAAGRRAIAEAAKRRWAAVRAAKASAAKSGD